MAGPEKETGSGNGSVKTGDHRPDLDLDLPVDKGWAWVILLAVSVIFSLSFGYLRAYGILFVEFLTKFQASSSVTALIMGTMAAVTSLTGFLVMNVGLAFFQVRTIVVTGGFIMFLGILCTSFASSISLIILCQGVFVGLGCAMLQGPTITILNQYFVKRRAMATSVATTGGTMGSVLIPLLMRWLLDSYGLSGAVLIFSGVVLHILIFSLLLRPMDDYKRRSSRRRQRQMASQSPDQNGSFQSVGAGCTEELFQAEASPTVRLLSEDDSDMEMREISESTTIRVNGNVRQGTDMPSSLTKSERSLVDRLAESAVVKYASLPDIPVAFSGSVPEKTSDLASLGSAGNTDVSKNVAVIIETEINSCAGDSKGETTRPNVFIRTRSVLVRTLDFRLLKRPVVWIVLLHIMFGFLSGIVFVIYLPALATNKGVSKSDAALLLSINSAVTIVSRPSFGSLTDLLRSKRRYMATGFLFVTSLAGMFTKFYNSFGALVALGVVHGVFGSIFVPMTSVLMVDTLGVQNFNKAYGFNLLLQGVFTAAAHPFCGFLSDVTGSFDAVFLFLCSSGLVAVVILLLLPCAERLERKAERDTG